LQKHFEAIELLLDEGLGLTDVSGKTYGTWFDLDDLLRMEDSKLIEAEAKAVGAGIKAPDEARFRLNLGPAEGGGGGSPYMQQQNYSLAALAKRDAQADPFAPNTPPKPAPADDQGGNDDDQAAAAISHWATRELRQFLATG
jgi:phage portal protein BeeE